MVRSSEAGFKTQKGVSGDGQLSTTDKQMESGRLQVRGIPSSQNPQE